MQITSNFKKLFPNSGTFFHFQSLPIVICYSKMGPGRILEVSASNERSFEIRIRWETSSTNSIWEEIKYQKSREPKIKKFKFHHVHMR